MTTGFPLTEAETPRIEVQGREPPPKLKNTTVDFVESYGNLFLRKMYLVRREEKYRRRVYRINYKIWELSKKNALLFRFRRLCKPYATNTINTVNPKLVAVRLEVQVT